MHQKVQYGLALFKRSRRFCLHPMVARYDSRSYTVQHSPLNPVIRDAFQYKMSRRSYLATVLTFIVHVPEVVRCVESTQHCRRYSGVRLKPSRAEFRPPWETGTDRIVASFAINSLGAPLFVFNLFFNKDRIISGRFRVVHVVVMVYFGCRVGEHGSLKRISFLIPKYYLMLRNPINH